MKTVILWGLALLNAMLLASLLGIHAHETAAEAQVAGRRPGEYLMIDGQISGGNAGLVYVVDSINGQLTALTFAGGAGGGSSIQAMPPIDLGSVFAEQTVPASGAKTRRMP